MVERLSQLQSQLKYLKPMTRQELHQFNGELNPQIYIACNGIIFDVSFSDMYKKGSGYNIFAGQDCTVNLAKMTLKKEDLNTSSNVSLSEKEKQILKEWQTKFQSKYPIIGRLVV